MKMDVGKKEEKLPVCDFLVFAFLAAPTDLSAPTKTIEKKKNHMKWNSNLFLRHYYGYYTLYYTPYSALCR